jgi:hypothetical protein
LGESVALLVSERLPVTLPAAAGAKLTLKLAVWPALSASGSVGPVKLKPVPVIAACETVTLAVPVFAKVTAWVLLVLPTVTSPKLRLAGLALRRRLTPVPERETVAGEFVALLTTEMLPVTLPVVEGAKLTLKVAVWPAVKVRGNVSPVRLNPVPLRLA